MALALATVAMAAAVLAPGAGAYALAGAYAAHDESPQIVDPAYDVMLLLSAPAVGLPEPSVDLVAATFARVGDSLRVTFHVSDIDFDPYPTRAQRTLHAYFGSDTHHRVAVTAFQTDAGEWRVHLTCRTGGQPTCFEGYDTVEIDPQRDTLTATVPLDVIQGRVLGPRAGSHIEIQETCCISLYPTFALQDQAPNEGVGSDFDPYA